MKKHSRKNKRTRAGKQEHSFPIFFLLLLILGAITVYQLKQGKNTVNVLGEKSETRQIAEGKESGESVEKTEPEEAPEPEETPEQEEEHEQEAEQVHQEMENEIKSGNVNKVEVQSNSEKPNSGKIQLERVDGSLKEKTVSPSTASLISVQNSQAGTVAISVSKNGMITLVNGGISVQTSYPVIIDPKSQTVAIKTPTGITVINTLPSQALGGVQAADKPTAVQTAVLGVQDGETYYDVKGIQERKFLGIFPVSAKVETKINTQNGSIISVDKPWYLNTFGFFYTI